MNDGVSATEVQKDFGLYQDKALVSPVTVTRHGRPSVVIVSAPEYERLRKLDRRQVLSVTELSEQDIAAIDAARIPEEHRHYSDDLL